MRSTAIAFSVLLAFGGPALAAHRAPPLVIPNDPSQIPDGESVPLHPNGPPACKKISDIKKTLGAHVHFATLTPAQYHFVEGIYVVDPRTPQGYPPGDGALLVTEKGAHTALVFWTRKDEVCGAYEIKTALAEMIPGIKTGPGETIEPSDGGEGDLSL